MSEEKSDKGKIAAAGAGIAGGAWLLAKALDPDTWVALNAITVNVWNFGAKNFWLVKLLALAVGVPAGLVIVLFVVGEILQGAYPKERGEAPRLIAGLIALSRGPKLIMRAIGRALAKRSKSFGLDFDEAEPPPAICAWKDEATGVSCGDPFVLHRGKAASDTDRRKGGFCMVPNCPCPGWVA